MYEIKINAFQGPFDLLFYLLNKNEVDIYDIPIAQITEQYLDYLSQMEKMDLDVASEFLVMAAKLLAIKAKMLLPKPVQKVIDNEDDEGSDPREELITQLLEYKVFKEVAHYLKEQEHYSERIFNRVIDPEEIMEQYNNGKNQLKNVTLPGLAQAFAKLLTRLEQEETITEVELEEVSIEQKITEITRKIFLKPNGLLFSQLFSEQKNIKEVVVTFLALLELAKTQQIILEQIQQFGDILIFRNLEYQDLKLRLPDAKKP